MSRDELHTIADHDTPPQINIPNTLPSLVVWALARFGTGLVVAGVFAFATKEVYSDMREDRSQLLEAYKGNTTAIQDFSSKINKLAESIEEAHRRANQ